ncbi:hypothetical protein [Acinetobacter sp. FDAARGOS_724]|uniref:hypothetical protein n=1 Tax=Acinetobacter sp. FDAARGOS_724 TaxID=2545797 RepID=UPI00158CB9D0|nr:hypothetical protein [Acinetobacter sp. FDAARGOS_724]QKW83428.1 hypothetical protein FOC32_14610 [Acinetobacter sp. FDAARGOS_724]
MNLIERYGSYDSAKARQQELSKMAADPRLLYVGKIIKEIGEIEIGLLEYRRQHNIYEVGDKVVYRNLPHERLFSVRYVGDDEIVVYELWDEMGAKTFTEKHPYSDIDHANDAEIKAGKRLEVNK